LNGGDNKIGYNNAGAMGYEEISGTATLSAVNLYAAQVGKDAIVNIRANSSVTMSGTLSVMDAFAVANSQGILTVADSAAVSAATMKVGNTAGASATQTGQFTMCMVTDK